MFGFWGGTGPSGAKVPKAGHSQAPAALRSQSEYEESQGNPVEAPRLKNPRITRFCGPGLND
jgi:hypothetical protein